MQPARLSPKRSQRTFPWYGDLGDGTYENPVIFADYSDPDVIRRGDEYYLFASSFNCTPGLPILKSTDLVNWELVGHALENLPYARYDEVQPGCGIWAPAVREHQGTYYLFAPTPDEGIHVLTAPHPAGPYSAPKLLLEGKGLIDPCPLWDDDGNAYLVHAYARSRAGIKHRLRVRPMTPNATRVTGEGVLVFHDPERQPTIEGPKFHKRNGWYYILAPAGGVQNGWQLALRSRKIYGPYEARVVLQQGSTKINGPHQGALIDTPEGDWWFVHFQDAGLYGRVVHVNPVTWDNDWPLMGMAAPVTGVREPVERHQKPRAGSTRVTPKSDDEFDSPTLGLQWQWHGNHRKDWFSLEARPGFLRLVPAFTLDSDLSRLPSLLAQKLPAPALRVETLLELTGCRAGMGIAGERSAAVIANDSGAGFSVELVIGDRVVESASLARGPVRLFMTLEEGGLCRFAFQASGEGAKLEAFETTFQARAGRWIGAKVGLFALRRDAEARGHADFEYVRFGP